MQRSIGHDATVPLAPPATDGESDDSADDRRPERAELDEIMGRVIEDAFVIPRAALRDWEGRRSDQVLVLDGESRLHFRDVEVLRAERDRVIVVDGLEPGERVCISPLRAVTEGMFVEVAEGESAVGGETAIPETGS